MSGGSRGNRSSGGGGSRESESDRVKNTVSIMYGRGGEGRESRVMNGR